MHILRLTTSMIIVLLLCLESKSLGDGDQSSLKGLQGVFITVDISDNLSQILIDSRIETDIEIKLGIAGLKFTDSATDNRSDGILSVSITSYLLKNRTATKIGIASGSVSVRFYQSCYLIREPTIISIATTWERDMIFYTDESDLKSVVREIVKDYMDDFINDYLKANPKE